MARVRFIHAQYLSFIGFTGRGIGIFAEKRLIERIGSWFETLGKSLWVLVFINKDLKVNLSI
jgi:hypothetical protein